MSVIVLLMLAAAAASLFFSALTYSLRDFSRARLSDHLERRGCGDWLELTLEKAGDLIFVTAVGRLFANILVLIFALRLFHEAGIGNLWAQYLLAVLLAGTIMLFCSVAIPHALAKYAGEGLIARVVRLLHVWRVLLWPVICVMHAVDGLVRRITGATNGETPEQIEQEIEEEILSVVEEGEKEGVVDEQEREMIESVIEFNDAHVGQIMTARPEIVALQVDSPLEQVKKVIDESGHSRIPVYEGTLDHIHGILYARDLLKYVGGPMEQFDIRKVMRPALYVPETKPLRDLLQDFRLQKIHIAMVLDEYGGTAGLVTIEDVLEELVGEISDEHEPVEPAMFTRLDDHRFEADARMYIYELNRMAGLDLPEEEGYDTLGGFVTNTLGRIPPAGTTFDYGGAKFTILSAQPHKVNRVKIEMSLQTVPPEPGGAEHGQQS